MMRPHDVFVFGAVAATFAGLACGKSAPRAAPDTSAAVAAPPTMPSSHFDVPLSYDITRVLTVVERAVPLQFGSLDSVHDVGDDTRKHYAYEAVRGPFTAFGSGSSFHLRATLTYRVRGFYKPMVGPTLSAGCGTATDEPPRIVIELASPLSLSARWHLVAHSKIVRVGRASEQARDRCQLRLIRYDVTDRVIAAARSALADQLSGIDRSVGRVDITGNATEWWQMLNRPIRLADNAWLMLGPETFRVGRVSGSGHTLTVHVGLDARPRIVTASTAPVVAEAPLPPLLHDTVSKGFHILMEGIVDYRTASHALTDRLRGARVAEGSHSVIVDSLTLAPETGGRLALTVAFHGNARGTLRFLGRPLYDAKRDAITMPDLDFDLTTDRPLLGAYAWFRSGAIRAFFRARALVPVRPALDRGRAFLLDGLNRKIGDAMTITSFIDSVAAQGLYITRSGVLVRGEARGHATVSVKEK